MSQDPRHLKGGPREEAVIAERLEQARGLCDFDEEVVVSAKHNRGLDAFIDAVYNLLPTGPRWFPKGTGIDLSDEVLIAEFIREKILRSTFDEVPHSVGVVVEDIERVEDPSTHAHLGGHLRRAR